METQGFVVHKWLAYGHDVYIESIEAYIQPFFLSFESWICNSEKNAIVIINDYISFFFVIYLSVRGYPAKRALFAMRKHGG